MGTHLVQYCYFGNNAEQNSVHIFEMPLSYYNYLSIIFIIWFQLGAHDFMCGVLNNDERGIPRLLQV